MKKKNRKSLPSTIAGSLRYKFVTHLTADFETCKTPDLQDMRVWAWGVANIFTDDFYHGTNIDDFMSALLSNNQVYDVAFHNLKFDGNYILPWLYRHGFTYLSNQEFMNRWMNNDDLSKCFTHNITIMGQWFNLIVVKDRKATPTIPSFIFFWDSMKLFPQTLKEVGEQYCTRYKKLDEDKEFYKAIRPLDHELTEEEYKYLRNDCLVLAEALKLQIDRYGEIKRTRASKAFKEYQRCCVDPLTSYDHYEQRYVGVQQYRVPKIEGYEDLEGMWWRFVPASVQDQIRDKMDFKNLKDFEYYIPNYDTWCELKGSYRGGIAYVDPRFKERSIESAITVIDVNSMYPAMLKYKDIPFGRMRRREGKPDMDKMWIACARVSFKLKNDYNLPCIQIKELYGREWLRESTDWRKKGRETMYNEDYLTFTSVDYETFCENYDFTVHDWLWCYEFYNASNGDGERFVDKFYADKQNADQRLKAVKAKYNNNEDEYTKDPEFHQARLQRLEAKIIMNSAYGKMGTKYLLLSKRTDFIDDMVVFRAEDHDFNKEPDDPSHYYLPYAAFVTSYARQLLVRSWNSLKGRAMYCDTDSIHFLGTPEDIPDELSKIVDWDNTGDLGLWGIEGEFVKARYIRAKTYIEVDSKGKNNIVCAGATPQVKEIMDWDNFMIGFDAWEQAKIKGLDYRNHSKLKPKQYPSGVDLVEENFQIKPDK